jgi:hypothetical protein
MDECELRVAALKQASMDVPGSAAAEILERAGQYLAFLRNDQSIAPDPLVKPLKLDWGGNGIDDVATPMV